MKRLIFCLCVLGLIGCYLVAFHDDFSQLSTPAERQVIDSRVPPIPASSRLPDPVPVAPAVSEPAVVQAPYMLPPPFPPGTLAGVGINPLPGTYPPGWGPCAPGTNSFGPGGAFSWGCPIKP